MAKTKEGKRSLAVYKNSILSPQRRRRCFLPLEVGEAGVGRHIKPKSQTEHLLALPCKEAGEGRRNGYEYFGSKAKPKFS